MEKGSPELRKVFEGGTSSSENRKPTQTKQIVRGNRSVKKKRKRKREQEVEDMLEDRYYQVGQHPIAKHLVFTTINISSNFITTMMPCERLYHGTNAKKKTLPEKMSPMCTSSRCFLA